MAWRGAAPAVTQRAGNQSQGYYAGMGPLYGGTGSGKGPSMASSLASGQGVTVGGQTWHPTVLYLGAFVIAEMVVFAFIGNLLSK